MGDINQTVEIVSTAVLTLFYNDIYLTADNKYKSGSQQLSLTEQYKNLCTSILNNMRDSQSPQRYSIIKNIINNCIAKSGGDIKILNGGEFKSSSTVFISKVIYEFLPEKFTADMNEQVESKYFVVIIKLFMERIHTFILRDQNISYFIDNRSKLSIEILQQEFYKNLISVKNQLNVEFVKENYNTGKEKTDVIKNLLNEIQKKNIYIKQLEKAVVILNAKIHPNKVTSTNKPATSTTSIVPSAPTAPTEYKEYNYDNLFDESRVQRTIPVASTKPQQQHPHQQQQQQQQQPTKQHPPPPQQPKSQQQQQVTAMPPRYVDNYPPPSYTAPTPAPASAPTSMIDHKYSVNNDMSNVDDIFGDIINSTPDNDNNDDDNDLDELNKLDELEESHNITTQQTSKIEQSVTMPTDADFF
jgi:hypothetical protein